MGCLCRLGGSSISGCRRGGKLFQCRPRTFKARANPPQALSLAPRRVAIGTQSREECSWMGTGAGDLKSVAGLPMPSL